MQEVFNIIDTMQRLPGAVFMLILFMSIVAALIINHVFDITPIMTLSSVPIFLLSGMFSTAVLTRYQIILSPDRSSNAALSTSVGFMMLAILWCTSFRIYEMIQNSRHSHIRKRGQMRDVPEIDPHDRRPM